MTGIARSLMEPPAFDAEQWPCEPTPPVGYKGVDFTFEQVCELIEPVDGPALRILDTVVYVDAEHLNHDTRDPNHPLYFEVMGLLHHYVASIWRDRVMIQVRSRETGRQSAAWPTTLHELRHVLRTMVEDSQEL